MTAGCFPDNLKSMSRLSLEEIEKMFAEFGLARDEDRQPYRDLSTIGFREEPKEESIKVACTSSPAAPDDLNDAELA